MTTELNHDERELLRPVLARYAKFESAHDGPLFEAIESVIDEREARTRAFLRQMMNDTTLPLHFQADISQWLVEGLGDPDD